MKCLITGATGFLGTTLTQELVQQHHEVIPLPRQILYDTVELYLFVKSVKPDWVFHLAAYGNKYDQTDEMMIIQANISSTLNMLYATKDINYKAFINCGSSSEYGTKHKPMKETDSLDTDTFYGVTKASATLLCRAFAKKYDKPVVTVRPFSVYGAGDDPNKFISTAINSFKKGEEMKLSPGVHDWIEVSDFISGLITVAKNATKLKGRAVNIGTGVQHSNHAVIAILKELFSTPGKVHPTHKLRDYDTSECWVADNTLLKSLGWEPQYSLEKGLQKLIYAQ